MSEKRCHIISKLFGCYYWPSRETWRDRFKRFYFEGLGCHFVDMEQVNRDLMLCHMALDERVTPKVTPKRPFKDVFSEEID